MDNTAQTTPKTVIRGDALLRALIFLERAYAASRIRLSVLFVDVGVCISEAVHCNIQHPYGHAHWYGHAALVAHERELLDPWDQPTRRAATFYIEDVAKNAIEAVCNFPRGPSPEDRHLLINGLTAYLKLFADGKIRL